MVMFGCLAGPMQLTLRKYVVQVGGFESKWAGIYFCNPLELIACS